MMIERPMDPPDSRWWPPDAFPPQCDPQCGVSNKPVMFIVIWLSHFQEKVPRTNPVTNLREYRNLIHVNEFWYFMNEVGCWAPPPPGFDLNPQPTIDYTEYVDPDTASGRAMMWMYAVDRMFEKGAMSPGSVHMLKDLAGLIPIPTTYPPV